MMVNILDEFELSAPSRLAVSYAPAHLRQAFAWMLAFESRMAGIVERAREPLIAQMRFAWWREMLAKPTADRPTGEPLLAALAGVQQAGLVEAAVLLVDAWELQAADPDSGRSAELRAQAVFQTYAIWVGCSDEERKTAETLGLCWAGARSDGLTSTSRKLRPLSILSLAAHLEQRVGKANGLRLIWHALTGR
jgi:15-cis-phytoene synthase